VGAVVVAQFNYWGSGIFSIARQLSFKGRFFSIDEAILLPA